MKWTLISATNNEEVLKSCLLNSPDVQSATEVILQTGYASAASAYNDAIQRAKTDLLVFIHQDVYLPEGWFASVRKALDLLYLVDPDWGVAGVWGVTKEGGPAGYINWTGARGAVGKPFDGVLEVEALDEIVLIIRKSSGLRFDGQLPGFHMYGTDLCLEARRHEMKCYAINAFCIHNTNLFKLLPLAFWRSYFFIRWKWKSELPVVTPCIKVTFWCWPMFRWTLVRVVHLALGRHRAEKRVPDPGQLYREMVRSAMVTPLVSHGAQPQSTTMEGTRDFRASPL
jgi:GT2 family glycosyltransferase